jgi:hypothetical protein
LTTDSLIEGEREKGRKSSGAPRTTCRPGNARPWMKKNPVNKSGLNQLPF